MMMPEDTICASATPPINSPISTIRISGPDTLGAVMSIFGRPDKIKHRYAAYGSIVLNDVLIDDVVLVYYKAPHSFTGEDMAEISCHGNPIIVRKVIDLLCSRGIRIAEPGEFSRRAFLNGKIDLTEAEAINHIITARSGWEVSSAIKEMHGALRDIIKNITARVINLKADIESGIDFSQEDIEFVSGEEALTQLDETEVLVADLHRRCRIGERISHGIDVPIVGRPNVGKSSILNLILNRERAIVSDIPGTTRDLIGEIVQFAGMPVHLLDTAGITESDSHIERIGVELSRKKIETAPVIIFVIDAGSDVTDEDISIFNIVKNKKHIVLANKIDLAQPDNLARFAQFGNVIPFSAKSGQGLAYLEKTLGGILRNEFVDYENSFVADMRIIIILEKALIIIKACRGLFLSKEPQEIIAFELQNLIDCLSEITGEISPDSILDSIFSRFCIGK
ncbi:MAG: tRNA uridine-5-carboxymethylaminomethyl(34) synthesis GTPase MnmE [Spirochaetes bacterium]|nr:tRNA uridine-5-carboxymethylaminomethyl(34) synthesis GTPase MnmE [Spirochaetota bacterium]